MIEYELCPICGKSIDSIFMEIHHYKPKSKGGTANDTMRLCGTCHDVVHHYIDIDDIHLYPTPQDLLTHASVERYAKWVSDKNHTGRWKLTKVVRKMAEAS